MTDLEPRDTEAEPADAEALARTTAREALVGQTIAGRYVLRGVLGHGGMGAVYEAEHLGLGKRVAIKFIDAEFATDEQVLARFARESRAMSAIESAHIVTVFDAGTDAGRPYLVMELLRGEDLGQRLRRTRRVPLAESMHVIAQVLKGLARAHAAGIVHRDLKPDNVFLVKSDTDPLFAKIVDFGISKIERPRASTSPLALTGRGTVLGTPFYMSPEQAQAAPDVDKRTDLYSVGAILFECLTGRPPHTGESYEQIILSICMRDAPDVRVFDVDLPDDVAAFVARALARDKVDRFTSAERMLAALHEVAPAERLRVPLDPPSQQTLASPDVAAAPPASRPSAPLGVATRLGVAALDPAGATLLDPEPPSHPPTSRPAVAAPVKDAKNARVNFVPAVRVDSEPRASGTASGPPARRPARRVGAAVATAMVAMLLGVGVTFALISAFGSRTGATPTARPTASLREPVSSATTATQATVDAASASGSASASASGSASASAAGSASASASGSPSASGPASASGAVVPRPSAPRPPSSLAPLPKASSKPLDINRELP